MLNLRTLPSIASLKLEVVSLVMHSVSESAITTLSSVYRNSHGTPVWNLLGSVSSMSMKSRWPRTEPWQSQYGTCLTVSQAWVWKAEGRELNPDNPSKELAWQLVSQAWVWKAEGRELTEHWQPQTAGCTACDTHVNADWVYTSYPTRGSRKFCQRGSKFDNVFFVVDGGMKRIKILL